jgi:hypothetical protein
MKSNTAKNIICFILIALLSICGIFAVQFLNSKHGTGASPDSVAYIAAARNIISGNGAAVLYNDDKTEQLNLWLPMHDNEEYHILPWPPFYPIILSIPLALNIDLYIFTLWMNSILFGLFILLVALFLKKQTGSFILPLFFCLTFIFSKELLHIYSFVWSEPIFFITGFAGLYFLIVFLKTEKLRNILLSSIFVSISFITRTAGFAFVAAGIIILLFFSRIRIIKKIINSIIFLAISIIPMLVWLLKAKSIGGKSTIEIIVHFPLKADFREMFDTFSAWIFSGRVPPGIRAIGFLALLLIFIILFIFILIKYKKHPVLIQNSFNIKIIYVLLIFNALYILTIISAKSLFDAGVPIGTDRILAPAAISTVVIVFLFFAIIIQIFNKAKTPKIIIFPSLSIFIILSIFACFYGTLTRSIYYNGQGYLSNDWKNSETIAVINQCPERTKIYTNEPCAVYLRADKNPTMMPSKYNIYTKRINENYEKQIEKMLIEIKQNNGLIAFFDLGWGYLANEKEIASKYNLKLIKDTYDGALYEIP